jgi:iron complex outermembrane receptor protein
LRTLLFVFLCSTQLLAQQKDCTLSLSGLVLDKANGMPVPDVTVFLAEVGRGAHTDSLGQYHIDHICPGTYQLVYRHLNHEAIREKINLNQSTEKTTYIDCHTDTLHEITVKRNRIHWEATTVSNTIQGADLFAANGLNLGKALEKVNGVTTLNTGNNISKPVIRGMHSNRVLIINNEIRQEGQQWGNEHAPEIDPYLAHSITVVKGAQTIRYGSDVMGGVILVQPENMANIRRPKLEWNSMLMSNGRLLNNTMLLQGPVAKLPGLTYRFQATYKRGGNQKTPEYFLRNSGVRELNYSAAVGYGMKNWNLELFYSRFNTHIGIFSGSHIGNLTDLYNAFQSPKPLDSAGFSYSIDLPYQLVNHQLFKTMLTRQTPWGLLKMVYGFQNNIRKEFDRTLQTKQDDGTYKPALYFDLRTHTMDVSFDMKPMWRLSRIIGIQSMYQNNSYFGNYFIPNYDKRQAGIYWVEKYHRRSFSMEAGLRYDIHQFDIRKWENQVLIQPNRLWYGPAASFAARYQFPLLTLHLNGGTTWRAPFVNELYSNGVHHSAASFEIGDSLLKPERGWNASLTLDLNLIKKSENELTFFIHQINNFINLQPVFPATLTIRGAFPTFQYQQVDARFYGVEYASASQLHPRVDNHFKASLILADKLNGGGFLAGIPPARLQDEIEVILLDKNRSKLTGMLSGSYTFRQNRLRTNDDYVVPPPAYFLVNTSLSGFFYRYAIPFRVEMGCNNVFNTTYRDYLNRNRYFANETGRNIYLKWSVPVSLQKEEPHEQLIQVIQQS